MAHEKFSISQDHKSYFFPPTSVEAYFQVQSSTYSFRWLSATILFYQRLDDATDMAVKGAELI